MKILLITASLIFSATAFANPVSLTVDIPANTSSIVVTAIDVPVDDCNGYGLNFSSGFGALEGTAILSIVQTLKACGPTTAVQRYKTLTAELPVEEGLSVQKFVFNSETMSNIKVSFE